MAEADAKGVSNSTKLKNESKHKFWMKLRQNAKGVSNSKKLKNKSKHKFWMKLRQY